MHTKFKASVHLYTARQAQGKEENLKRIAQLQKIGGNGNQRAIQELRRKIGSIDQLMGAAALPLLNQALVEHQDYIQRRNLCK